MELLLVRHAKAEEREEFAKTGADDELRPLTHAGVRQMRRIASSLHAMVPRLDVIASSPLTRAMQTAEILAQSYKRNVVHLPELAPGNEPAQIMPWLRSQGDCGAVALVGHEPDLGLLASWLLSGGKHGFMPFKKAGACLIRLELGMKGGNGELAWFLTPRQLREMGG